MSKISIDPELCIRCGTCTQVCPEAIFCQEAKDAVPTLNHVHLCFGCVHCVAACPKGAVSHAEFPEGSLTPVDRTRLPSADQLFELLRSRRSIRAFSAKPVAKETIEQIIEAARFAPSGHNHQGTEFVVIQDKEMMARLAQLTAQYGSRTARQFRNPLVSRLLSAMAPDRVKDVPDLLDDLELASALFAEGRDSVLHDPPVLLVFHGNSRRTFSDVNATLALQNAALMAHALGLGCFYAGYLTAAGQAEKPIRELLSLPENHQIYGALAIGHPRFKYEEWIEKRPARVVWM